MAKKNIIPRLYDFKVVKIMSSSRLYDFKVVKITPFAGLYDFKVVKITPSAGLYDFKVVKMRLHNFQETKRRAMRPVFRTPES